VGLNPEPSPLDSTDWASQETEFQDPDYLPRDDDIALIGPITPKNLEIGASAQIATADEDLQSSAMVILPPEATDNTKNLNEKVQELTDINQDLAYKNQALTEENNTLKSKIAVLEAQNKLFIDRLNFNDQVIFNLITNR
jgi:hypothetical protein